LDDDLAHLLGIQLAGSQRIRELNAECVEFMLSGEDSHDQKSASGNVECFAGPDLAEEMSDHEVKEVRRAMVGERQVRPIDLAVLFDTA
jgi:hypothetical protein